MGNGKTGVSTTGRDSQNGTASSIHDPSLMRCLGLAENLLLYYPFNTETKSTWILTECRGKSNFRALIPTTLKSAKKKLTVYEPSSRK